MTGPLHLLIDSTGVKLSGPGEWLVEKHGTQRCSGARRQENGVLPWFLDHQAARTDSGRVNAGVKGNQYAGVKGSQW
jgi:hypothetical protein